MPGDANVGFPLVNDTMMEGEERFDVLVLQPSAIGMCVGDPGNYIANKNSVNCLYNIKAHACSVNALKDLLLLLVILLK